MKNEFDYLNDVTIDFSAYEEAELSETERAKMKNVIKKHKKISRTKIITLAACVGAVAVFSQTVFARELVSSIINSLSTGYNQFVQTDDSNISATLPKELKGLIFDENGNEISQFDTDGVYYDKDGNKIEDFKAFLKDNLNGKDELTYITEDGEVTVGIEYDENTDDPLELSKSLGYPIIEDPTEIDSYLSFESQLPEYLPDGYEFYGASAYGTDYLFVYYKNPETDQFITVDERIINDETAFGTGTDGSMYETDINGCKAVVMDDKNINWETDGISIGISMDDQDLAENELIKIAESVK